MSASPELKTIFDRFTLAKQNRENLDNSFSIIEGLMLSGEGGLYQSHGTSNQTSTGNTTTGAPQASSNQIFSTHPFSVLKEFAEVFMSSVVDLNANFFKLQFFEPAYRENETALKWAEKTTTLMKATLTQTESNFFQALYYFSLSLGFYGYGVIITSRTNNPTVMNFTTIPSRQVWFNENEERQIDEIFYTNKITYHDLIRKFPDFSFNSWNLEKDKERKFTLIHCVYPNRDSVDLDKKYIGKYILEEEQKEIQTEYYKVIPYLIGRWTAPLSVDNPYPVSLSVQAIPSIRKLYAMTYTHLHATQMASNPAIATTETHYRQVKTRYGPGAMIPVSDIDGIKPIMPGTLPIYTRDIIEDTKKEISQIYLVDRLELSSPSADKTATEINIQELHRIHRFKIPSHQLTQGVITPLLERVFNMLIENEILDPIPEKELEGALLVPSYEQQPIQAVNRNVDYEELLRFQNLLSGFSSMVPPEELIRFIDIDMLMQKMVEGSGIDQEVKKDSELVAEEQEQMKQQQEELINNENALKQSEVLNNLGSLMQNAGTG